MLTRHAAPRGEEGFTVLEMMVVLVILSIVLAIVGNVLMSVTHAANQGEALVENEQQSTLAIGRLARDLRAANPLQPIIDESPTSGYNSYADQIQVTLVNPTGGAPTTVEWVYDPNAQTLTREVLSGPHGSVVSAETVLRNVFNCTGSGCSPAQPVFRYWDNAGNEFTQGDTPDGTIATCTTRVTIDLISRSDPGPLPFQETKDVELRNQIADLQATGGDPCGSG